MKNEEWEVGIKKWTKLRFKKNYIYLTVNLCKFFSGKVEILHCMKIFFPEHQNIFSRASGKILQSIKNLIF